ncbi:hypothetical protein K493DRAFT_335705 [Basidiobolus meristosporus CBS 931.73]|uniref:Phospholipase A2 n=1 Tax=Basidiobolus meristosporus CBS 931.73 TaxID=1314790 RepID=A0A1Y1YNH9_9FUNG|nr:hypothetical protein K493DRAFT_335705 [Basidiobolus meristosporus CBS 931.73]|eukprot:ORX99590.1 hypothetical protein K493DRAFT_335705 [Basidiobolus meristosporus CBS 931.73]
MKFTELLTYLCPLIGLAHSLNMEVLYPKIPVPPINPLLTGLADFSGNFTPTILPPLFCPEVPDAVQYQSGVNAGCGMIKANDQGLFSLCCDLHDQCYSRCGVTKFECENEFRQCMYGLCPEFARRNVVNNWGDINKCDSYWSQFGGTAWALWRIGQAQDFSCDAFETAQRKAGCFDMVDPPYLPFAPGFSYQG